MYLRAECRHSRLLRQLLAQRQGDLLGLALHELAHLVPAPASGDYVFTIALTSDTDPRSDPQHEHVSASLKGLAHYGCERGFLTCVHRLISRSENVSLERIAPNVQRVHQLAEGRIALVARRARQVLTGTLLQRPAHGLQRAGGRIHQAQMTRHRALERTVCRLTIHLGPRQIQCLQQKGRTSEHMA